MSILNVYTVCLLFHMMHFCNRINNYIREYDVLSVTFSSVVIYDLISACNFFYEALTAKLLMIYMIDVLWTHGPCQRGKQKP